MEEQFSEIISQFPDYPKLIEELIPSDALSVAVKINVSEDYGEYTEEDINFKVQLDYGHILRYFDHCGFKILASSGGWHLNGKSGVPHIHYHFFVENYAGPALTNPSQHRNRYFNSNGIQLSGDLKVKFKTILKQMPAWQFLSYPLKEGIFFPFAYNKDSCYKFDGKRMSDGMLSFLLEIGNSIYRQALALRERQNKCSERKQLALNQLFEICRENNFSSYKQMREWLEENYLDNLPIDELPELRNYNTNCQKVGKILKLFRYCDN